MAEQSGTDTVDTSATATGSSNPTAAAASPQQPADTSRPAIKVKYDLALLFFKSNADACGKLEYEITTRLMALSKHAIRGPFVATNEPELGWFDFVGTDRRNAWIELGDMSKDDAMTTFCSDLAESVPEFSPWLTARLEEKARKEREEKERLERERLERERAERERKERLRQQELERERLERERQQALQRQQRIAAGSTERTVGGGSTPGPAWATPSRQPVEGGKAIAETPGGTGVEVDIKKFREMLQDQPKNCITVSYGEVVRVKVPNPQPGKSTLKWQFCTEYYDIGFGLDFETTAGAGEESQQKTVLPIMRIQADTAVSIGNHTEPAPGQWVVIFDNSYSYVRSKTVFFTVTNS